MMIASVAGCAASPDETPVSDGANLTYAESYGFCAARCFRQLSVQPDGLGIVTILDSVTGPVVAVRTFHLTDAELQQLNDEVATAASHDWEPVYGCPDCADQGTFEIVLRGDGSDERKTVIDPMAHPAFFDDLLDHLRALLVQPSAAATL